MKTQILIIEDDKKVANFIKKGIEDDTWKITLSINGIDGLKQAKTGEYGLIILDQMLPRKDGMTVLHELRESGSHVPVLMLTAKADTYDIVAGLDAGADAYMAKPFAFAELKARVKALVRRSKLNRGAEINFADVKIDPVNHRVWRSGKEIELTTGEYKIFAYFVRNAGRTLSRADIIDNCWDTPPDRFSNIVDVYINYLRKKIDGPFPKQLIQTIRGKGYVLKE